MCSQMPKLIDETGKVFGRLTVKHRGGSQNGHVTWLCLCSCGKTTTVKGIHLRNGSISSCGCFMQECSKIRSTVHGRTRTPEYNTWCGMKQRCYYEGHVGFLDYGGRGIKVCDQWKDSFENFLKDMGEKPSSLHSIDRIDVDGNYEPGNCRWATPEEQERNKRFRR